MKNFAITGAAGFVAPRHMQAIKETGNNLSCAMDISDSVGVLDSYFPGAEFFMDLEDMRDYKDQIDFLSVCTPNHLHYKQILFGLDIGCDVICEKPIVLNPWEIDYLAEQEKAAGKSIYNILQLRLHPSIVAFKKRIDEGPAGKVYDIDLSYITARGRWYFKSWKADPARSGGIATNIGVHFFDMLAWIFGEVKGGIVHVRREDKAGGFLEFERARVRWFLSVDPNDLPVGGGRVLRSIRLEDEDIEFSDGFAGLHTHAYEEILAGRGFGVKESKTSIKIVHDILNARVEGLKGDYHPMTGLYAGQ